MADRHSHQNIALSALSDIELADDLDDGHTLVWDGSERKWKNGVGAGGAQGYAQHLVTVSLGAPGNFDIVTTPDEVAEGTVTFLVSNDAAFAITHEFLLLKTDTTAADLVAAAPIGGTFDEFGYDVVIDSGDLAQGASFRADVDLAAGHYVAVCNEAGHAHNGMAADFTVNASGGSTPAVYARVYTDAGTINDWAGTAIPFASVATDPDSLWDAVGHKFVVVTAGWYRLSLYATGDSGGIVLVSNAEGPYKVRALVNGAGDNLVNRIVLQNGGFPGDIAFPPLVGETHFDAGDSVTITGDGGSGWTVYAGTTFSIELVAAD